jgi:shikimate kinase
MNLNKNIVLLGMMGSGKSTIGYLLSKNINFNFLDIDKLIEKEMGLKIYDIFQKKGEIYFRNLEEKITFKFLKGKGKIISLGGGAFLNKNIRKEILKNHISFWLSWNNSTIIKRILKSKKRPIAFISSENNLKKLINERSNIYSEAKFKINCETLTKNMIVKNIIELYEKN